MERTGVAAGLQNKTDMRKRHLLRGGLVLALLASAVTATVREQIALWPEHQRAFVQDGTVLLLDQGEKKELLEASSDERDRLIEEFFDQDPVPETPRRTSCSRRSIAANSWCIRSSSPCSTIGRGCSSFVGHRSERNEVECGMTFKPIEIWTYGV